MAIPNDAQFLALQLKFPMEHATIPYQRLLNFGLGRNSVVMTKLVKCLFIKNSGSTVSQILSHIDPINIQYSMYWKSNIISYFEMSFQKY